MNTDCTCCPVHRDTRMTIRLDQETPLLSPEARDYLKRAADQAIRERGTA